MTAIQQHLVMIEYLLLKDLNDAPQDAEALVEYLRGIPVHINLIPYNPIAESPHLSPSDPERRAAFSEMLKAAGLPGDHPLFPRRRHRRRLRPTGPARAPVAIAPRPRPRRRKPKAFSL